MGLIDCERGGGEGRSSTCGRSWGIAVFGLYSVNVFENHNCRMAWAWGGGMFFFVLT